MAIEFTRRTDWKNKSEGGPETKVYKEDLLRYENGLGDVVDELNTGRLSVEELDASYAPVSPTTGITYNPDGSVATVTENGVTTTYTYNPDGSVATDVRAGVTRTYTYDGSGNLTGISS